MIEYELNGEYIDKIIKRDGDEYRIMPRFSRRWMHLNYDDGQIQNNTDTETIVITVVDGLEVVRGTHPTNATVLDYNGDVNLSVDGTTTTKTLTNGSVSFDLTTDKPAGSEIEIVAESLADYPAESDSATIEVVSQ